MDKKFLTMKKIPLKTVKLISDLGTALVVILYLVYLSIDSTALLVIDIILVVALVAFIFVYSRCPGCGRVAPRRGKECSYCKEILRKD